MRKSNNFHIRSGFIDMIEQIRINKSEFFIAGIYLTTPWL